MANRYEHGTICKVVCSLTDRENLMKNIGEDVTYVYIDKYQRFGTYKCYKCDVLGEVAQDAKPLYIHHNFLIKYTAFPGVSPGDLQAVLDTLSIFQEILTTGSADFDMIGKTSLDLAKLSTKLLLIKSMGDLHD